MRSRGVATALLTRAASGALDVGGVREKGVTLALAKSLQKNLCARGFAVVPTRDRDRASSLENRTAIAEGIAPGAGRFRDEAAPLVAEVHP